MRLRFITPILCVLFSVTEVADAQVPQPEVTITAPTTALFSDTLAVVVSYRNAQSAPDAIGFYPIIEVVLPDGIRCDATCRSNIVSTNPAGAPLTLEVHGDYGTAGATYANSITGEQITLTNNETLLIITPPMGTLAVGQPAISVAIPATFTAQAVLSSAEIIRSRGIFVLGDKANGQRGPCGQANDTICQSPGATASVTPTVLLLEKTHAATPKPATGPNYPRNFSITADVATGKTVTGVTIVDVIPPTVIVTEPPGSDCSGSASFTFNPAPSSCSYTAVAGGGGSLSATYASIVGGVGTDVTISFAGYVQEYESNDGSTEIIDAASGAATSSFNVATADFSYLGSAQPQATANATIDQRSLVSDKSGVVTNDAAPVGNSPGDTITWTTTTYVSDYFSFDDLVFTDDIADGQTYVPNSFLVTVDENSTALTTNAGRTNDGAFGPSLTISPKNGSGVTHIDFDVSAYLVNILTVDDTLTGDDFYSSGSPTSIQFSYQTIIDENFVVVGPGSATLPVDGGDIISNSSIVDFQVTSTSNRQTLTATAEVPVAKVPSISKEIAFKNGGAPGAPPVFLGLGDNITYKITVPIPTGDLENFLITDYLPTPILDALDPDADGSNELFVKIAQGDSAPGSGEWRYTSASYVPSAETVTTNGDDNTVKWDFADHIENGSTSTARVIEILFTLAATNKPYGNGLKLVNIGYAEHANSAQVPSIITHNAISDIHSESPHLLVQKGALTVLSGNGSISSGNFLGVDAGDVLRFEVQITNDGDKEAFDVEVRDSLPGGLLAQGAFNIAVSDGGGLGLCNTGSFNTTGTSGNNLVITSGEIPIDAVCKITYDVVVDTAAMAGQVLANTVGVLYASEVGGPDFSPEGDTASTTLSLPTVTKAYQNATSSDNNTSDPNLRPGESASFLFTVTVSEGTANSFKINERDTGDLFVNLTSAAVSFGAALEQNCSNTNPPYDTYFNFSGLQSVCFSLDPSQVANQSQDDSTNYRINFGTLVNFNTNDSASESFTLTVTPTLRNITTGSKNNAARVEWNNGSAQAVQDTEAFTVVKPTLTLSKTTTATPPLAIGATIPYILTVNNSGTSAAYDVLSVVDTMPTGLGSASLTSALYQASDVTGQGSFSFSPVGQTVTVSVVNSANQPDIVEAESYVVRFSATIEGTRVNDTTNGPGHPGGVVDGPGCVDSLVNSFDIAQFNTGDAGSGSVINTITAATNTLALDSDGDGVPNSVETLSLTCPDSDGDGVDDYLDTDSDDNGVPDSTEYNSANDGDSDGTPDYRDTDDDNDLLSDWTELSQSSNNPLGDKDGDGVPNWQDPDSDNDGILDSVEGSGDADGDSVPNNLDLDSDDDGIVDILEAGGIDNNGDGLGDTAQDTDSDGILDIFDSDNGGSPLNAPDTDGDGRRNFIDIDADGDGLVDNIESQSSAGYVAPTGNDADNDGLDDAYDTDASAQAIVPRNTDSSDNPDYLDLDSDNDSVGDLVEGHDADFNGVADSSPLSSDGDNDGLDDRFDNFDLGNPPVTGHNASGSNVVPGNKDGDASPDWRDIDDDNDGLLSVEESNADFDGDGLPNRYDLDSDDDGLTDIVEVGEPDADGNGKVDSVVDTDGDGLLNPADVNSGGHAFTAIDSDGDSRVNNLDIDSDGDGITDNVEAQTTAGYLVPLGVDSDSDGLDDRYDSNNGGTSLTPVNTDGGDLRDYLDTDSDNDGILDAVEGHDANGDGLADHVPVATDADGDGLDDSFDNFNLLSPPLAGFNQTGSNAPLPDHDSDGQKNWRDTDDDGDSLLSSIETTWDQDSDGHPDYLDVDTDGDGLTDGYEGTLDSDGDGLENRYDLDSDDDGIRDIVECAGQTFCADADHDSKPNYIDIDSDNDGLTDIKEVGGVDLDGDGRLDCAEPGDIFSLTLPDFGFCIWIFNPTDSDGDGLNDYLDIDADNDGLIDNVEAQTTTGYRPPVGLDGDGDGLDDRYDTDNGGIMLAPENTDGDGTPDYLDLDSDGDGADDYTEGYDNNGDGLPDINKSGNDTDHDGLDDAFDNFNLSTPPSQGNNATGFNAPQPDSDHDGEKNWRDTDDDGDGLLTVVEGSNDPDEDDKPSRLDTDSDGDGLNDHDEGVADSDGDGTPDYLDPAVCTLTGSIQTQAGEGIGQAVATLIPSNLQGISQADGSFAIERVANGNYRLDVRASDGSILGSIDDIVVENGQCGSPRTISSSFQLRSPIYFVWNSFLRQDNIVVLGNKGEETLLAEITLYDINGLVLDQSRVAIPSHSEKDYLVNAFEGYGPDTYGFVKVEFDHEKYFDGHSAYYRLSEDGQDVEFSMLKPFENLQTGTTYAFFNTMQVSLDPEKADDESPQWIQIVNLDNSRNKRFTLRLYNQNGQQIWETKTLIPPHGRRDIQAGHQFPGIGHVGLVEVLPEDQSGPYLAQLFSYSADGEVAVLAPTWSFAGGVTTAAGQTVSQYVPVSSGSGALEWLNIANVSPVRGGAAVEVLDSRGNIRFALTLALEPMGQRHILASAFLSPGETGIARIRRTAGSISARSVSYFFDEKNWVTASYPEPARIQRSGPLGSFWNTFWNQENWLRLTNVTSSRTIATVRCYTQDGVLIGEGRIALPPLSSQDLELASMLRMSLVADSYGVVLVSSSEDGALVGDILRVKRLSTNGVRPDLTEAVPLR